MKDTAEVALKRIATVLAGECSDCKWAFGCSCVYCVDNYDDVILYRCPSCHAPGSPTHKLDEKDGGPMYFIGTADGTTYSEEYHWYNAKDGVAGNKVTPKS